MTAMDAYLTRGLLRLSDVVFAAGAFACVLLLSGCGSEPQAPVAARKLAEFKEPVDVSELVVTTAAGERTTIGDFSDGKNLVVVISRGYFGKVCPYCSAQVQRLAGDFPRISKAGGNVLVVFPVALEDDFTRRSDLVKSTTGALSDAAKELPFSIVGDIGLHVVKELELDGELAKPATYILDRKGGVRYIHVGLDPGDRPDIDSIIFQLETIQAETPVESETPKAEDLSFVLPSGIFGNSVLRDPSAQWLVS